MTLTIGTVTHFIVLFSSFLAPWSQFAVPILRSSFLYHRRGPEARKVSCRGTIGNT